MASSSTSEPLKFAPFSSAVDVSFFQELSSRKLNSWGLSTERQNLQGSFQCARRIGDTPRFIVGRESFHNETTTLTVSDCISPGSLLNVNTIEEFKTYDKVALIKTIGNEILNNISNGKVLNEPELLNQFLILSFADLKSHKFLYWFCFPALVLPTPAIVLKRDSYNSIFNINERKQIRQDIEVLRRKRYDDGKKGCNPFFMIIPSSSSLSTTTPNNVHDNNYKVLNLSEWNVLSKEDKENVYFGFVDPCGLEAYPGWTLRNYLFLIKTLIKNHENIKIICYRSFFRSIEKQNEKNKDKAEDKTVNTVNTADILVNGEGEPLLEDDHASFVMFIKLENIPSFPSIDSKDEVSTVTPQIVGWESNPRGKPGPKSMNLKSLMDPMKLAESSADLNLSLMKWRAIPTLNTKMLSDVKILLLGAGTLGCSVSRTLLGWGIRNITFVDNGKVSYSNPTRQSLFEYADCLDGGKYKSEAASEALKRIYPNINSIGHILTIPMPGHNIETELNETQKTYEKLKELILEHDVIYLLTDTRESRWLPTMLCASHDKMMIDVALGMDSYLVMRHGAGPTPTTTSTSTILSSLSSGNSDSSIAPPSSSRLGCYFCNDVVAPQNSTKDRTLDQQCTVTRPGLAPIASALAVELMVALLHHPLKHHAPADINIPVMQSNIRDINEKPLGCLPHQLRGFLSNFGMLHPQANAFEYCTACNVLICDEYHKNGFDFIRNVCNNTNYLSKISGLEAFQKSCEELVLDDDFGMGDEDGDDF